MNLIIENWHIFVGLLAFIFLIGNGVFYFFRQPSKKQLEQIKQWLIFITLEAEKQFQSGTGQIKLRFVYDAFLTKFRWISFFMSFETFSLLVDEALDEMKKLLETNKAVENIVKPQAISK